MALAARLSQRGRRVLLLEAGGNAGSLLNSWIVRMPSAYGYAYRNPKLNWGYYGEPEPSLNMRKMYQPRGRVLGGSSAVNGMGFVRAHPAIFRKWVSLGCDGWGPEDVLPYYKRLETWHGPANPLRGTDGPVHVIKGNLECPYYETFFEAGRELGHGFSDDINASVQEGFGAFQLNVEAGVRSSTDYAYLRHVARRENLTIITNAHVAEILFRGEKAVGVRYMNGGNTHDAYCGEEVILSAGAFNSPKLLMLAGIGPEDDLRRHGLPVRVNRRGVGENLQDHPIVYPKYEAKSRVSPVKYNRYPEKLAVGLRWFATKGGPCASNQMEAIALLRSEASAEFPDIEFQFCPLVLDHDAGSTTDVHGWSNSFGPVSVETRGWVKLSDSNPLSPPRILCNFFNSDSDIRLMLRALETNRELMETAAFRKITRRLLTPHVHSTDRKTQIELLRQEISGDYHPVGTCRMGAAGDPDAVVDSDLRVIGVQGLRVADASIMPVIPNANTNATSIMIGEKAADHLLSSL